MIGVEKFQREEKKRERDVESNSLNLFEYKILKTEMNGLQKEKKHLLI